MKKETLIKHLRTIGLFSAFILILALGYYLFVVNPELVVHVFIIIWCIIVYMAFYMLAND